MKLLNNIKNIHFIGIAGISMSALAFYLANENPNLVISGSDIKLNNKNEIIKKLKTKNIKLINKHSKNNIYEGLNLVIYNAAIDEKNIEILEALKKNIKIITRSNLLSYIMKYYKTKICISGTHGKTTTTSMLSNLMLDNKLEPTIMIGSFFEKINGNIHIGKKNFFITEACEYKNAFLDLNADISIILNIDNDHLDFFHNMTNIKNTFQKFCEQTKKLLIVNNDDINIQDIIKKINNNIEIITFGQNDKSDFYPKNIQIIKNYYSFDVYYKNKLYIKNIIMSCLGEHNIINALSVIALSHYLNIETSIIKISFQQFKNSKRRFEIIKNFKQSVIISDYAHHPKEIEVTLNTAKIMNFNKIICVFQPHTFSRTIDLLDQFINVLKKFDFVILIDIYACREEKHKFNISSESIVSKLNNAKYINNSQDLFKTINKFADQKNAIIFMGAGNIDELINIF